MGNLFSSRLTCLLLAFCLISYLPLFSCGTDSENDIASILIDSGQTKSGETPPSDRDSKGTLLVTVIDVQTLAPIQNAFVMVGDAPAPGDWNWTHTNSIGQALFSHADISGAQTVTAGDSTHTWMTIFLLDSSVAVLPLAKKDRSIVTSTVSGDISVVSQ